MKNICIAILLFTASTIFGQAYSGKEDLKFQVGANFQDNGTGIVSTVDYGIGENISLGVQGLYILGVKDFSELPTFDTSPEEAQFGDRFDVRVRFNAHLGNVINIDENFDLYPGLNLGLKNFGGHLGARYFFTPGFGVYTEFNVPFAKYSDEADLAFRKALNNQFTISFGASFNL